MGGMPDFEESQLQFFQEEKSQKLTRRRKQLKVITWNVNSINTSEAELYDIIDKH